MAANEEAAVEFDDDVLEIILSHVPLVHLVPASHVSKAWRASVSSSLRHRNKPSAWLIRHTLPTLSHAYDPRSNIWIKISRPAIDSISDLKSSHSSFLYTLSLHQFSFSFDPLNFEWHHVEPPLVWRSDPIVARVGNSVIIAGGVCDFADDPLAVEIYDLSTRRWRYCDIIPESLRDTSATPFLTIAATAEKLIVADKESGLTHWFDPVTNSWSKPFNLRTDQPVINYNIGSSDTTLILVGLCRIQNVERVKIWRINGEEFECEEIGEMPLEYVEKLRSSGKCSISALVTGNIVYVYNNMEEVVACELDGNRWWRVRNVVAREGLEDRMIFTCADVGIDDLLRAGMGRFVVIDE